MRHILNSVCETTNKGRISLNSDAIIMVLTHSYTNSVTQSQLRNAKPVTLACYIYVTVHHKYVHKDS